MTQKIDDLLSIQRAEGVFQSAGEFLVDLESARKKVSQFGLEKPGLGLLKLAQFSIQNGAQGLRFQMGRDTLTCELDWGEIDQDFLELPEALQIVVWSCLQDAFKSCKVESGAQSWTFCGKQVEHSEVPRLKKNHLRLSFERNVPSGFWWRLKMLLAGRVGVASLLSERLHYAPIPVTLDRWRLNCPNWKRSQSALILFVTGSEQSLAQEITAFGRNEFGAKYLFHEENLLRTEENHWSNHCSFFEPGAPNLFGVDDTPWTTIRKDSHLARLWLPSRVEREPRITLVKDGVVVGEIAFATNGVVSAGGLDMDLSGLRVVQNQKLDKLVGYLHRKLERAVDRFRKLPGSEAFSASTEACVKSIKAWSKSA